MTTRFKSPVYSELALWIVPKTGQPPVRVRAHRGYFDVEPAHVKAFKKAAGERPQYRIEEVGEAPEEKATKPTELHGKVEQAPGITAAELDPEIAKPTEEELEDAPPPTDDDAIEAADDEADAADDDLDDDGEDDED